MPYDEDLAGRIRELIGAESGLTEKRMFGGLAFLIHGNMAVAASGQGGIMVRVGPDQSERLAVSSGARVVEMRGRPMKGWLRVAPERLRSTQQLARWVNRGIAYTRSLPPKARRGDSTARTERQRAAGIAAGGGAGYQRPSRRTT